jgi:hypothetical protein
MVFVYHNYVCVVKFTEAEEEAYGKLSSNVIGYS